MRQIRQRWLRSAGLLLTALLFASLAAPARAQVTQDYPGTRTMLLAYYTAINQRDYTTAYTFWSVPQQTFTDFAAGFASTARVEPYFGRLQSPPAISQVETGRVPAVVLGYHLDGIIEVYTGCFSLVYREAPARWQIVTGNLTLLSNTQVPDFTTMAAYLQADCYNMPVLPLIVNPQTGLAQIQFIRGYYDAVNRADYATAYASWLQPIAGPKPNGAPAADYRLPYTQFVSGYQDTAYVYVYPGIYNEMGASAGHSYLNGMLPTVLISQQKDGSVQAYVGCYVLGQFDASRFGIVNGSFSALMTNTVPEGPALLQALNIDCTQLAIPD